MSTDNDQESLRFWSSLLQSLAETEPKDDIYPEFSSPMMVMSTSMSVDVMPEPWKVLGDGDKEAGPEKATVADGDMNINKGGEKSTEKVCKEREEDAKENRKNLGKRPRNEARNIAEKRRRTGIKDKIQKLKQLTNSSTEKDLTSTLGSIVDRIREMKFYVESRSMGPMLPLGMGMDFPAPWFPFVPPNYVMPFNGFTPGETSGHDHDHGHDQQIVPFTTKGFNNQLESSKSM